MEGQINIKVSPGARNTHTNMSEGGFFSGVEKRRVVLDAREDLWSDRTYMVGENETGIE